MASVGDLFDWQDVSNRLRILNNADSVMRLMVGDALNEIYNVASTAYSKKPTSAPKGWSEQLIGMLAEQLHCSKGHARLLMRVARVFGPDRCSRDAENPSGWPLSWSMLARCIVFTDPWKAACFVRDNNLSLYDVRRLLYEMDNGEFIVAEDEEKQEINTAGHVTCSQCCYAFPV